MNPLFVNYWAIFSYILIERKDLYFSPKDGRSLILNGCPCYVLREHTVCISLIFITMPYLVDIFLQSRCLLTQKPHIDSCRRNILCLLFPSCPLHASLPFLADFPSQFLSVFASLSLCLWLLFFLPSSFYLCPPHTVVWIACLSLFHFLLYSQFLALPACVWLPVPPRQGFRTHKAQTAEGVTHIKVNFPVGSLSVIFRLFLFPRCRSRLKNEWQVLPNMQISLQCIRMRLLKKSLTFSIRSPPVAAFHPCPLFF